jgi:hypothetical protein
MSTENPEKTEHIGTVLVEEDADKQTHPHVSNLHQLKSGRPCLPEKEILRRLWRIYEMALAAASRSGQQ